MADISDSENQRFPLEKVLIMVLVIGLLITVTAVSINFAINPPGQEKESMFSDDPSMTNNPAAIIIRKSREQE